MNQIVDSHNFLWFVLDAPQLSKSVKDLISNPANKVSQYGECMGDRNDPFDRLIIAQSLVETMPIISEDTMFDRYGVQRLE